MILTIENLDNEKECELREGNSYIKFRNTSNGIEANIEEKKDYTFYRSKFIFLNRGIRILLWLFLPIVDLLKTAKEEHLISIFDFKSNIDISSSYSIVYALDNKINMKTKIHCNSQLHFTEDNNAAGRIQYKKLLSNQEINKRYATHKKQNFQDYICTLFIIGVVFIVVYNFIDKTYGIYAMLIIWITLISISYIRIYLKNLVQLNQYLKPLNLDDEVDYHTDDKNKIVRLTNFSKNDIEVKVEDDLGLSKNIFLEAGDVKLLKVSEKSKYIILTKYQEEQNLCEKNKYITYLNMFFEYIILNNHRVIEFSFKNIVVNRKKWKSIYDITDEKIFIDFCYNKETDMYTWEKRDKAGVIETENIKISENDYKEWKNYLFISYSILFAINIVLIFCAFSFAVVLGIVVSVFLIKNILEICILLNQGKNLYIYLKNQ